MPAKSQGSFPLPLRIALLIPLLILWALALVAAVAFLFLTAVGVFFWSWEGKRILPYALLALAVTAGAVWLSAMLIRKIDRLSKAEDHTA